MQGIYQIRNILDSKVYIGSSINIERRFEEHKTQLKYNKHKNKYLQNAWNKYKQENFSFLIIEIVDNKDLLVIREQYYLDYFKSYNHKKGYNINPNAENSLGRIPNKKTRLKMSLAAVERCKKYPPYFLGKKLTKNHKKKLSLAKIGTKRGKLSKEILRNMQIARRKRSSLSIKDILYIKRNYKPRVITLKILAEKYKVHLSTIFYIVKNKFWKEIK